MSKKKRKKRNAKNSQKIDSSLPKQRDLVQLQMILDKKSEQIMEDSRTKRKRTKKIQNEEAIKESYYSE